MLRELRYRFNRQRRPLDPVAVAMLHVGRCGSTVVGRMLDEHPLIQWDGEVFEPSQRATLEIADDLSPSELVRLRKTQALTHYGFETKYLQAHHLGTLGMTVREYVGMLRNLGFDRFVALHRRNYLRRAVSGAIGRSTGEWHRSEPTATGPTPITLDPLQVPFGEQRTLLDVFKELSDGEEQLRESLARDTNLWLTYEDDIAQDPRIAYRKLCDLFGVIPTRSTPALYATNPFPLHELLANYAEIAELLAGTEYEWMLTD